MGPRLFIAGPILDGVPPLWPDTTVLVDTVARAEAAVLFLAANGVDVIKVYNSVPEVSLVAIVRTAHELGLPVTGHVPRSLTMTRAIEIGIDGLEHIRVTGREMLPADEAATLDYLPVRRREGLLWDRFDPDSPRFEELARRIADARVFLDPTFVVDAEPLRDEAERAEAERMDHLPSWVSDAVGEAMARRPADVRRVMETPAEVLGAARSGFRKRQRFVGMCARAGARIVSGTDHVGPGDDLPGRGIQRELAYLVESGLSTAAALRASTLDAAASLGSENDLGAVEPGRLADLLVLDADPLADIANVARIRTVVHGGRVATPTEILAKPPAEPEAPYAT
jgi:imidazolonepropionase-like amidohydrolase